MILICLLTLFLFFGSAQSRCTSDLDCGSTGGLNRDANCYRDSNTGQFYTHSSSCIKGECVTKKVAVKCCPDYCSSFGQQCDYSVGCKGIVHPKPDCPPNMCCDGFLNKVQQCDKGLVCCLHDSPHNGHCETYEECSEYHEKYDTNWLSLIVYGIIACVVLFIIYGSTGKQKKKK